MSKHPEPTQACECRPWDAEHVCPIHGTAEDRMNAELDAQDPADKPPTPPQRGRKAGVKGNS